MGNCIEGNRRTPAQGQVLVSTSLQACYLNVIIMAV